jgi:hypothetical protein
MMLGLVQGLGGLWLWFNSARIAAPIPQTLNPTDLLTLNLHLNPKLLAPAFNSLAVWTPEHPCCSQLVHTVPQWWHP